MSALALVETVNERNRARAHKHKILRRANSACEVCGFGFKEILHVHHIVPVSCGGRSEPENMIALCPNCHGIAHRLCHAADEETTQRRVEMLINYGMTEQAARRVLLVGSRRAIVHPIDGLIKIEEAELEPEPKKSILEWFTWSKGVAL